MDAEIALAAAAAEAERADLDIYGRKVKKGGLLFLDDYVLGNWWGDGVTRAVHEFLAAGGSTILFKIGNQIAIKN